MTDDTDDGSGPAQEDTSVAVPHSTATYKLLGELAASDGVGVLGHNTATTGAAVGIQGVTDSAGGYGMATPDDAGVAGVTELTTLAGSLTGGTEVTGLAGDGLTVDGSGALTWTGSYRTYTFTASGTTEEAVTGLSGATPVEVTVDANGLTDGRIAVTVDGTLRAETIDGVLHRVLEPTSSLTLESDGYFSFDTSVGIAEDTSPTGVAFRDDGTKMFVVGSGGDSVYSYDLSTAWDVASFSYTGNALDVSGQDGAPEGVRFKPDGTRMFVVGSGNDSVYQYDLSIAWDLTSASFLDAFDVSGETGNPGGIAFGDSGSKMFVVGASADVVYVYDLLSPWDAGAASYSGNSLDVSGEALSPEGIAFRDDGRKLYVLGRSNNAVYSYVLSTAWDVTSAVLSGAFDISPQTEFSSGLATKGDDTRLFVVGYGDDRAYQYIDGYGGTAYAAVERG